LPFLAVASVFVCGVIFLSGQRVGTEESIREVSQDDTGFFLLSDSTPFKEFYAGADRLEDVSYVEKGSIIRRCLTTNTTISIPLQTTLAGAAKPLLSIGDIAAQSDMFALVALKVAKSEVEDITPVMLPPRIFGENLCSTLPARGHGKFARFCVSDVDDSAPEDPKERADLRVPVLAHTRSGLINKNGFVRKGDFEIVPTPICRKAGDNSTGKKTPIMQINDPVFIISHYRGEAVYHHIIENMARLAPYYDELVNTPEVKIHTATGGVPGPFMEFLGFPSNRLISGDVYTTNTIIFPDTAGCGSRRIYILKKLREVLLQRMFLFFGDDEPQLKQHVLVIRRSKKRAINNFDKMMDALVARFPEEKFVIFRDDPVPSVADSFRMFYEAKMVIAPHGAGLANAIMCNPGTPILEFLVEDNTMNMCFVWMSSVMGLRHETYAPPGSTAKGNFTVDIDMVLSMAAHHLN
jgi:hypothetical protein